MEQILLILTPENVLLFLGIVIPLLTPLWGKLGRIGWALGRALGRLKDGHFSDQDKIDTFDDLISIWQGLWFNKTQAYQTRGDK